MLTGTPEYWGPEVYILMTYHAGPATVWSLGALLFRLVCGYFPYSQMKLILRRRSPFRDGLSYSKVNSSVWSNKDCFRAGN